MLLGADSKTGHDGIDGVGLTCKIIIASASAAAMAGHLGDSATAFNAAVLIRRALSEPGDLALKVRALERLAQLPLQRSLDYGRRHAPSVFASKCLGKKALQTIFAAVEEGTPKMIVSTFRVSENGQLNLDEPKELGPGQVYVFGETSAIAKYQSETPTWNEADPLRIIEKFLELESHHKPDLVGLPLSVVRISSTGTYWSKPGLCAPPSVR